MYRVNFSEIYPSLREVNSLIFELGSILDFFARMVNISFDLGIKLRKVSFSSVGKKCRKELPDEKITHLLYDFSKSDLYKYFRDMRNRITHRLPFVLKGMNDQIFFPDDPNDDALTPSTEKMIDVKSTCFNWLSEILSFVDRASYQVYLERCEILLFHNENGEELNFEDYIKRKYGVVL